MSREGSPAREQDRGLEADLTFAQRLADVADEVTMRHFRSRTLRIETKPDKTPVSNADREAEQAVRAAVAASDRDERVLGEVFGGDGGEAHWIVDPVDGTTSYLRGVPIWGTLLALQRNGTTEVGLVSAPALGRRWWATLGGGAFADNEPCHVSGVARLEDAAVSTTSLRRMPEGWRTVVEQAWSNRGLGDFWQHCLVAEGALDVATDGPYMRVWDYSATRLIVEEAGGRCTTLDGAEPHDGGSILSTNGLLHEHVMSLLAGGGDLRLERR